MQDSSSCGRRRWARGWSISVVAVGGGGGQEAGRSLLRRRRQREAGRAAASSAAVLPRSLFFFSSPSRRTTIGEFEAHAGIKKLQLTHGDRESVKMYEVELGESTYRIIHRESNGGDKGGDGGRVALTTAKY
nr:hypothetical protein Iba_chr05dCG11810 [Ipomoea batatas]